MRLLLLFRLKTESFSKRLKTGFLLKNIQKFSKLPKSIV